jgi:hypothetical protein
MWLIIGFQVANQVANLSGKATIKHLPLNHHWCPLFDFTLWLWNSLCDLMFGIILYLYFDANTPQL